MNRLILTVGLGFVVVATACAADVTPNIDEGTMEMRLHGSLDTDTPLDYDYQIGGAFGLFVMDGVEVGVGVNARGNDLATHFELGAFAEYVFDMDSSVRPVVFVGAYYAGVEVDDDYYNKADETDFDTAVGKAGAGVLYFLRDSVAVELSGVYSFAADDLYVDQDGNLEDSNFTTVLGLRFYWD